MMVNEIWVLLKILEATVVIFVAFLENMNFTTYLYCK